MRTLNRTAVVVTPKQPFLDWLCTVDSESPPLTREDVVDDPSVYLLPDCRKDVDAAKQLSRVCRAIFQEQLNSWYQTPERWPQDLGFPVFQQWFDYQFHSMVIDLCTDPLIAEVM